MPEISHPYVDTAATQMLSGALRRYTELNRGGLRALAKKLDLKQATVLSHMANGRMAIPLDRAPQLALALGMEPANFTKLVLKQRSPDVFAILEKYEDRFDQAKSKQLEQLEAVLVGGDAFPSDVLRIIAEVVRDRKPEERWLAISEVAVVRELRNLRPAGLDHVDLRLIRESLERRPSNSAD